MSDFFSTYPIDVIGDKYEVCSTISSHRDVIGPPNGSYLGGALFTRLQILFNIIETVVPSMHGRFLEPAWTPSFLVSDCAEQWNWCIWYMVYGTYMIYRDGGALNAMVACSSPTSFVSCTKLCWTVELVQLQNQWECIWWIHYGAILHQTPLY